RWGSLGYNLAELTLRDGGHFPDTQPGMEAGMQGFVLVLGLGHQNHLGGLRNNRPHKLDDSEVAGIQCVIPIRITLRVVDELAIETPVFIGAGLLGDFPLEIVGPLGGGAIDVKIQWNAVIELGGGFGQRRVKFVDEDVPIQVNGFLVTSLASAELPFKERKIRQGQSFYCQLSQSFLP